MCEEAPDRIFTVAKQLYFIKKLCHHLLEIKPFCAGKINVISFCVSMAVYIFP
jgi:hypothetical protein